jgi:ABC-2 type transport system ATP-binding protein
VTKSFVIPRPFFEILRAPFDRRRISVLADLWLTVPRGSLTGLLGPNGAGKTTLLRILAASILPDSGTVRIFGQDTAGTSVRIRERIGFVLGDERSFYWRLTASQNLLFFAALHNLDRTRARSQIEKVTGLLQLAGELKKPFRDLSTGMRQRLALARALLHDPELLLIDEPTRGLDPGAAKRTRELIGQTLVKELGKTVLLATHNLAEAQEVCDRVALLKDKRILRVGPPREVLTNLEEVFE